MKEKQEKSKEKTEQSKAVRKRKNRNVGLEDSHSETRVRNRKQKKVPKETISKKSSKKTSNSDIPCSYCGRLIDDPEFAEFGWVKCEVCNKWFHDICEDVCDATGVCGPCQM